MNSMNGADEKRKGDIGKKRGKKRVEKESRMFFTNHGRAREYFLVIPI